MKFRLKTRMPGPDTAINSDIKCELYLDMHAYEVPNAEYADYNELTNTLDELLAYTRNLKDLLEDKDTDLEYKFAKFYLDFCDADVPALIRRGIVRDPSVKAKLSGKHILYGHLNHLHMMLCSCLIVYSGRNEIYEWWQPDKMHDKCWCLLPGYMPDNSKHVWEPYYVVKSMTGELLPRVGEYVYNDWRHASRYAYIYARAHFDNYIFYLS